MKNLCIVYNKFAFFYFKVVISDGGGNKPILRNGGSGTGDSGTEM